MDLGRGLDRANARIGKLEDAEFNKDPIRTVFRRHGVLTTHKAGKPMDKKIHKITDSMKVAGKDIAKGKPKLAGKVLKGAEKRNEKLVKLDKVRDKIIDRAKRSKC